MNENSVEITKPEEDEHPMAMKPDDFEGNLVNAAAKEEEEENRIKIALGTRGGFVLIGFSKDTRELIMTKSDAREFARRITLLTLG